MGDLFITDAGSIVELDVPAEGTFRRQWHDQDVERGHLRPLGGNEKVREVETHLGFTKDGDAIVGRKLVLEEVAVEQIDKPIEEREELMQQAKDLGLSPHHRTGVERLRTMIDEATAPDPADGKLEVIDQPGLSDEDVELVEEAADADAVVTDGDSNETADVDGVGFGAPAPEDDEQDKSMAGRDEATPIDPDASFQALDEQPDVQPETKGRPGRPVVGAQVVAKNADTFDDESPLHTEVDGEFGDPDAVQPDDKL